MIEWPGRQARQIDFLLAGPAVFNQWFDVQLVPDWKITGWEKENLKYANSNNNKD